MLLALSQKNLEGYLPPNHSHPLLDTIITQKVQTSMQ